MAENAAAGNYRHGRTLRERLLSRLIVDPSGCLLWTGSRSDEGYGHLSVNDRMRSVHRLMWEMFNGPIPGHLVPDHLCRVRHCANLAHLELVTTRENILRGTSLQAVNARKTHCDSNHPFDAANTYWRAGERKCRACNREAVRRYKARKAAQS